MSKQRTVNADMVHPVLALRDLVVFPGMVAPLFVGREKSVRALQHIATTDRPILLLSQRDASEDDPGPTGLYEIGTLANVVQLLKLPDGTYKATVEGESRAKLVGYTENPAFLEAAAEVLPDELGEPETMRALMRGILDSFMRFAKSNKNLPPEVVRGVAMIEEPGALADTVASNLSVKISERQELLEIANVVTRMEKTLSLVESEIQVSQVEHKIKGRIKRQMERSQKEYYLNEQMKAIQRELGEGDGGREELVEIEEKIRKTRLSKEAREKAEIELRKLSQMAMISAEATVLRNYLDWLLSIPWGKRSRVKTSLTRAEKILDADHYGLEKVKERIVEYLAVQRRTGTVRGPVLCLVGPPGVGKTSLGKSIARATGREFIRISLGGIRDEAEIRGHRRTYVGAMPGKIIQAMRKAKTTNPLIMFDEIDKMGFDFRGDPSSAMLEVLDPEQNANFVDHYLEVQYDLSDVLFITTANTTLHMTPPLLDRMEVLHLAGYTEDEKVEIAARHLIPKQLERHGLERKEFSLRRDALREIIRVYTREAGVRNLERDIAKLCRKAVTNITKQKSSKISYTKPVLSEYLGVPKFRYGMAEHENRVGVSTGLAYTETGGDLLSIEALKLPGRGRMKTTGKLGEVMKESIEAAASYVRANAARFGILPDAFGSMDIHVHVPEGATPKDGPSAGVGMVTSIVSVLTGIPVRKDVAMTGEVTLRGDVLAIGGLKEKLLAALRGGIQQVIIPEETSKFLEEIPDNVKEGLTIIPVKSVGEVLDIALDGTFQPIEWDETAAFAQVAEGATSQQGEERRIAH